MVAKSEEKCLQNTRGPRTSPYMNIKECRRARKNLCLNRMLNDASEERVNFYHNYSRSIWNRFTFMFTHDRKKIKTIPRYTF